jgi:hypothetical protein
MRNSAFSAPAKIDYEEPYIENDNLRNNVNNIPGDTIFEKFQLQADCMCCGRHQIGKPVCIYIPYVDDHIPKNQDDHGCMCPCRHMARQLNRIYTCSSQIKDEPKETEEKM